MRFISTPQLARLKSLRLPLMVLFLLFLVPLPVWAHPATAPFGLLAGLVHPATGTDHLLAMVAVGLWAGLRGGRYVWALPVAFVTIMLVGAGLAVMDVPLTGVEGGIAASVLVLGVCVALYVRLSPAASLGVVGVFALLHGYAHGQVVAVQPAHWGFAVGAAVTTALLHAMGVFGARTVFGLFNSHRVGQIVLRAAGAGVALAGGAMVGATL